MLHSRSTAITLALLILLIPATLAATWAVLAVAGGMDTHAADEAAVSNRSSQLGIGHCYLLHTDDFDS